jgi:membrane protein
MIARVFWTALRKFDRDQGLFLAGAIAFSLLLSVIPLCLLLLAVLGSRLSSDAAVADHLAGYLRSLVPAQDPKIMGNIVGIIRHRKTAGVIGLAGLAWTATMVFSSLRISLNAILGVTNSRGTLRALAVDLLMIVLSGTMLLGSMALTSWIGVLQHYGARFGTRVGPLSSFLLKYPVPFLFTLLMCFMVYKIAPNRRMPIRPCLEAALFTALFWELAKQFFNAFVLRLDQFTLVYGSLSTVAAFVLWVYYSAVIFLLGAEVAFALEHPRGAQRTAGRDLRTFLPK